MNTRTKDCGSLATTKTPSRPDRVRRSSSEPEWADLWSVCIMARRRGNAERVVRTGNDCLWVGEWGEMCLINRLRLLLRQNRCVWLHSLCLWTPLICGWSSLPVCGFDGAEHTHWCEWRTDSNSAAAQNRKRLHMEDDSGPHVRRNKQVRN